MKQMQWACHGRQYDVIVQHQHHMRTRHMTRIRVISCHSAQAFVSLLANFLQIRKHFPQFWSIARLRPFLTTGSVVRAQKNGSVKTVNKTLSIPGTILTLSHLWGWVHLQLHQVCPW